MKKKDINIIIVFFLFFIVLSIFVISGKTIEIDKKAFAILLTLKCDFVTKILYFLTTLGNEIWTIVVVLFVSIILFLKKKYKKIISLICSVSIGALLMKIIKGIIKRPRPIWKWIKQGGYSFPSGHTISSIVLYGYLISLVLKSNIKYKKIISSILFIIMILIPISRIYFGVHYLTDIIGGILIGIIIRILTRNIESRCKSND